MNASYVIELKNLTAGYSIAKGFKSIFKQYEIVLKDINIKIKPAEKIAIIGESGSGKTTLFKTILGLLKPIKGEVLITGISLYELPWGKRIQILKNIGYVPQDPYRALNPRLRIKKILVEPLEVNGLSSKEIEEEIREIIKVVKLPEHVLELTPNDLSGGMRQRVLIARALIHKPRVLLLDEPTSSLDVSIQAQIINLLNETYSKFKVTMITVTHDLAIAQYLANRIVILRNGEIVEEGLLVDILEKPKREYTKMLISSYNQLKALI